MSYTFNPLEMPGTLSKLCLRAIDEGASTVRFFAGLDWEPPENFVGFEVAKQETIGLKTLVCDPFELIGYLVDHCHIDSDTTIRIKRALGTDPNEPKCPSCALLRQHAKSAWNRGHTMGMIASEGAYKAACAALAQEKADHHETNVRLTEALLHAESRLAEALAQPAQADACDAPELCPTCGAEDGGTTCGMPNCGLLMGEPAQPAQAVPSDVERDAARYRWLRTWVKRDVDTQAVVPMTGTFQATALSLDELDAAIDTAMLAAAPEGK